MTLSIDDLEREFRAHWLKHGRMDDDIRAGIRAVVKALRDECDTHLEQRLKYGASGDVWNFFNEILAPRGDEAAGGSTREDGTEAIAADPGSQGTTPAAAPTVGERLVKAAHEAAAIARGEKEPAAVHTPAAAPDDVCEWSFRLDRSVWATKCGQYYGPFWAGDMERAKACHHCTLPIRIVEAAR